MILLLLLLLLPSRVEERPFLIINDGLGAIPLITQLATNLLLADAGLNPSEDRAVLLPLCSLLLSISSVR